MVPWDLSIVQVIVANVHRLAAVPAFVVRRLKFITKV